MFRNILTFHENYELNRKQCFTLLYFTLCPGAKVPMCLNLVLLDNIIKYMLFFHSNEE